MNEKVTDISEVYLSVVMFLPYGRMENFFREVFGLEISQGSFVNWVGEVRRNAAPAIEKIKECIMNSTVVGFDESGLYCNKRLDWTWYGYSPDRAKVPAFG